MATHNEIGKKGEALALGWLEEQGFRLLDRNWRYSRYEIDLIVCKEEVLHVVEVKTGSTNRYGFPEERVTARKFGHLKKATAAYLDLHPCWTRVQYDILSVHIDARGGFDFLFLADCYQ